MAGSGLALGLGQSSGWRDGEMEEWLYAFVSFRRAGWLWWWVEGF